MGLVTGCHATVTARMPGVALIDGGVPGTHLRVTRRGSESQQLHFTESVENRGVSAPMAGHPANKSEEQAHHPPGLQSVGGVVEAVEVKRRCAEGVQGRWDSASQAVVVNGKPTAQAHKHTSTQAHQHTSTQAHMVQQGVGDSWQQHADMKARCGSGEWGKGACHVCCLT